MKTTNSARNYATETAIPSVDSIPHITLAITRTITDMIELPRDPQGIGLTIGGQIDNQINSALDSGATLSELHLDIPREQWEEMRQVWFGRTR